METENRPNAALINREWFDSACRVLNPAELGWLLIEVVEYVLNGKEPVRLKGNTSVVFTMIRPALDSDIAKYRERCARNADNARRGSQRVAASGTQPQRVAANTTTTPTTTPTTTTTPTLSLPDEEQRKRDRFIIFGYFWSVGSNNPMGEMDAFWDYYESLGWKNNKGAVILSKIAAARMWRRQFETKTPPDGAGAWFKVVQTCSVLDPSVFTIFAGIERNEQRLTINLRCTDNYIAQMRQAVPDLEGNLRAVWRGMEVILHPMG